MIAKDSAYSSKTAHLTTIEIAFFLFLRLASPSETYRPCTLFLSFAYDGGSGLAPDPSSPSSPPPPPLCVAIRIPSAITPIASSPMTMFLIRLALPDLGLLDEDSMMSKLPAFMAAAIDQVCRKIQVSFQSLQSTLLPYQVCRAMQRHRFVLFHLVHIICKYRKTTPLPSTGSLFCARISSKHVVLPAAAARTRIEA